ncbi:hypothetical protein GCM10020001_005820 [Nonomuraea salmonea]
MAARTSSAPATGIAVMPGLPGSEDAQHAGQHLGGPPAQRVRAQTGDGVADDGEGVPGEAADLGHGAARREERLGDDAHGGHSGTFQRDAVGHGGGGAGAAVADGGEHDVAVLRELLDQLLPGGQPRAVLDVAEGAGRAVAVAQLGGQLREEPRGVGAGVVQQADGQPAQAHRPRGGGGVGRPGGGTRGVEQGLSSGHGASSSSVGARAVAYAPDGSTFAPRHRR